MKKTVLLSVAGIAILTGAYLFGAYSYRDNWWPLSLARDFRQYPALGEYDSFNRLVAYPGKQQSACPRQTDRMAVILAIGQSNAANHAVRMFTTRHPSKVFNYFQGRCYAAASPLLGASGERGEFLTPLADALVENGTYDSVVIVSSAIGESSIYRWQRDGDLNEMLARLVADLKPVYQVTEILWHQGETDFRVFTTTKNYVESFTSLAGTLRSMGVAAPIFMSVATKCRDVGRWNRENPIAIAQRQLVDGRSILLGVDTDDLLVDQDRREDNCHFRESGQLKTAAAVAAAIGRSRCSDAPTSCR